MTSQTTLHLPNSSFSKVCSQIHPSLKLSKDACEMLGALSGFVFDRVMSFAIQLAVENRKRTISSREVQSGVRMALCGSELAKHAVFEGTKAVTKACSNSKMNSKASGLTVSVATVKSAMRAAVVGGTRIGGGAPVYLAAVLEYMAAEVIEIGGNTTQEYGRSAIEAVDLTIAIQSDEELNAFFYYGSEFRVVGFKNDVEIVRFKWEKSRRPLSSEVTNELVEVRGLLQASSQNRTIPKVAFQRLVREVAQDYRSDLRFSTEALDVLQASTEQFIVDLLAQADDNATASGIMTIMPKHVLAAVQVLPGSTEAHRLVTASTVAMRRAGTKPAKTDNAKGKQKSAPKNNNGSGGEFQFDFSPSVAGGSGDGVFGGGGGFGGGGFGAAAPAPAPAAATTTAFGGGGFGGGGFGAAAPAPAAGTATAFGGSGFGGGGFGAAAPAPAAATATAFGGGGFGGGGFGGGGFGAAAPAPASAAAAAGGGGAFTFGAGPPQNQGGFGFGAKK